MGNNQGGGLHKRERTGEGRNRLASGGFPINSAPGASIGTPAASTTPNHHRTATSDDGCPVQLKIAKSDGIPPDDGDYAENNEYPVVFKWHAHNPARHVYVTGSWDTWKRKIPLVKSTHDFSTILNLNPGRYEYKFLVDGKWCVDDTLSKTDNAMGSQNNVISIDNADFVVFDALERDLASSNAGEAMKKMNTTGVAPSHDTPNDRELEKLREFTQTLPDRRDFEKAASPPVLPPHLLQVILNKDTPVHCDPNVLPEPNHVMLNHLYALSIKDGVMVLSATHRHRKKYVTTLLYKPIAS
uniref:5'-AMP-activated protein kinase subunit beta-1 n=1 Tax=Panagrellus redivivus TaxID=6233 RepID=A0A7E4WB85_PANRE